MASDRSARSASIAQSGQTARNVASDRIARNALIVPPAANANPEAIARSVAPVLSAKAAAAKAASAAMDVAVVIASVVVAAVAAKVAVAIPAAHPATMRRSIAAQSAHRPSLMERWSAGSTRHATADSCAVR